MRMIAHPGTALRARHIGERHCARPVFIRVGPRRQWGRDDGDADFEF